MKRCLVLLERFCRDKDGYVLVFFALVLVPMLGITALVVDISRQQTAHTELQSMADAAALAGAQQLDGTDDAITNATSVAATYLSSRAKLAELASGGTTIRFFSGSGCATPNPTPREAECIEVTTERNSFTATFAQVMGVSEIQTVATATAETRGVACAVTPLFMCSPQGPNFNLNPGQMVHMKKPPSTGAYGPGNFGLLDPNGQTSGVGAWTIAENLAKDAPEMCYISEVSANTGFQTNPVSDGINARFDRFDNIPNGQMHRFPDPPASNVIKGARYTGSGNNCSFSETGAVAKLPRDNCASGTTPCIIGDGNWSNGVSAYFTANHVGKDPTALGYTGLPGSKTRFDLYLDELGVNEDGTPRATSMAPNGVESMAPQCRPTQNGTPHLHRRIIYVAIVDCTDPVVQNWITGNSGGVMKPMTMAQFFLFQPSTDGEILGEFIRVAAPDNDLQGKFRQIVRLVRQCRWGDAGCP